MFNSTKIISASFLFLLLASCGGGGGSGSSGSPATSINLTGTAATGLAISGGAVTANCVAGSVTPTTTDSLGSYTLTLTNATLPCIVKVTTANTSENLYSIVESGQTTANVTPLTHLLSDILFGADSATVFANFGSTYSAMITTTNIASAQTKVQTALTAIGIDITAHDVLKSSFTPATAHTTGSDLDQKLDQLQATLQSAQTSLSTLSTSLNSGGTNNIASVTTTAIGPAAKQLGTCPYVRGGNYWTFLYDGSNQTEWTVDLNAMTAKVYGTNTTYPVAQLTSGGSNVPCAFTITLPASVITAYFSKSSIFGWKQLITSGAGTGGYYFGLGIPVQTISNLGNKHVGTYPTLGYVSYANGANKYQSTLPMQMKIDSSGNVTSASCSLANGVPSCASLSAPGATSMTCGSASQGMITCTDGTTTVKVFALITQEQPTVFMLMSGVISSLPFNALVMGTKANTLSLPPIGYSQSTSSAWYLGRPAQNNPNTSWSFVSGDSTSGAGTTVANINTSNSSYTTTDGITFYLNTPIAGFYWVPTVSNTTYPSGTSNMVTLVTNAGIQMRGLGKATATTFDNFNGVEFFIRKPM
jgi:hypothetical protein